MRGDQALGERVVGDCWDAVGNSRDECAFVTVSARKREYATVFTAATYRK